MLELEVDKLAAVELTIVELALVDLAIRGLWFAS